MPASSTATSTVPFFHVSPYPRHWRIIATIWTFFGIITGILQLVVLVHPAWLSSSNGVVQFGLYDICFSAPCEFVPWQIRSISTTFDAAAICILAATTLSLIAVFSVLLLFVMGDGHVFKVVGWMHLFSCMCQVTGIVILPLAWNTAKMTAVCESNSYDIGNCLIRWPFLLAIVLAVDHLTLAILGMVLSCKRPPKRKPFPVHTFEYVHHLPPPPPPEVYFTNGGSMKL